MPRPTYTIEQLLELQDSPLIKRPEHLPWIEQWLEPPTERATRTKAQTGKAEENENPTKRPLFERVQSSRHAQTGEDVFLGPKMSFATASAARNNGKVANGDDKAAALDDLRHKYDRFAPRDKHGRDNDTRERDGERQKPRYGQRNHADDDTTHDGRPRRNHEVAERARDHKDGGVPLEGTADRRNRQSRGKLDQPWFRDASKPEVKDGVDREGNARPGWRERERKRASMRHENVFEQDDKAEPSWMHEAEPAWMQDTEKDFTAEHTIDDLVLWKNQQKAIAAMKAGINPDVDATPTHENELPSNSGPPVKESDMKITIPETGVFGIWGEAKREADIATPKASSKPKSSRFAGFFAPKDQEPPPIAQPEPVVEQPPPLLDPAPARRPPDEDQAGFQRMMAMLKLGGTSSREPREQARFPPPPPQPQHMPPPQRQRQPSVNERQPVDQATDARRSIEASQYERMLANMPQYDQPRQSMEPDRSQQRRSVTSPHLQQQPPRLEIASRETERDFLLKLMRQPRATPPFNEGQIYGRNYHSTNSSSEINNLLNSFAPQGQPQPQPQPQQETRSRGPPPGLRPGANDNVYSNHYDGNFNAGPVSPEDRFPGPHRPHPEEEQRRPQMIRYDQATMFRRQQAPNPQDMRPPPGFSTGGAPSRGAPQGLPPGFPQYPPGPPPQQHPQQHPQQRQQPPPPQYQQPPPPSSQYQHQPPPQHMRMQPPGFGPPPMQGPGPGPGPGPGSYPPQQAQQPPRRPPMQMQVPPGYEGYGDMARRGPPMGYPQYLDQRGGGY